MFYMVHARRPKKHRENEYRIGAYSDNRVLLTLYRAYLNRKHFFYTLYPEAVYTRGEDKVCKKKVSGYDVKREGAARLP